MIWVDYNNSTAVGAVLSEEDAKLFILVKRSLSVVLLFLLGQLLFLGGFRWEFLGFLLGVFGFHMRFG